MPHNGEKCENGPRNVGNAIFILSSCRSLGTSTANTTSLQTNPVELTNASIQSFLGTGDTKLVFVNVTGSNRTLCTVNFNQAQPAVNEFTDSRNVNVPEISPNGRYVAWCTNGEGLSGPSSIYIRYFDSLVSAPWKLSVDSGYIPRWWVDKTTGDTFLIYVIPPWTIARRAGLRRKHSCR